MPLSRGVALESGDHVAAAKKPKPDADAAASDRGSGGDDSNKDDDSDVASSSTEGDYDAAAAAAAVDPEPVEELPVMDDATGRVYTHDGSECIGRITVIKESTPQEAVSVYCRRHQCKIMKRSMVAPSREQIIRWLACGLDIPRGTNPGLVRRHKELFPAM